MLQPALYKILAWCVESIRAVPPKDQLLFDLGGSTTDRKEGGSGIYRHAHLIIAFVPHQTQICRLRYEIRNMLFVRLCRDKGKKSRQGRGCKLHLPRSPQAKCLPSLLQSSKVEERVMKVEVFNNIKCWQYHAPVKWCCSMLAVSDKGMQWL